MENKHPDDEFYDDENYEKEFARYLEARRRVHRPLISASVVWSSLTVTSGLLLIALLVWYFSAIPK